MILENVPLARQLEIVFREIKEELVQLTSGTVFVQIRNNVIGKFGVRAFPLESKGSQLHKMEKGLTDPELYTFWMTAKESLKLKNWSHGEIQFEFAKRQDKLCTSVAFESNYNMASIMTEKERYNRN